MKSSTQMPGVGGPAPLYAQEVDPVAPALPSLARERVSLVSEPIAEDWFSAFDSAISRQVLEKAQRFVESSQPMLILGEHGTGRLQLARRLSAVASPDRCVLSVPCSRLFSVAAGGSSTRGEAAIHELCERHRRDPQQTWLFEGIDEISYPLQPQFLSLVNQILNESAARQRPSIISTSNQGIVESIAQGRYRADLFYRLNVLELRVPALRERQDDIPHLVNMFSAGAMVREGAVRQFAPEAIRLLCDYHWPGNLVELKNLITQLCLLSDQPTIDAELLSRHWPAHQSATKPDLTTLSLEDAETHLILEAVSRCQGNKTAAAKQLGITPRTLHNKMLKYRRLGFVA